MELKHGGEAGLDVRCLVAGFRRCQIGFGSDRQVAVVLIRCAHEDEAWPPSAALSRVTNQQNSCVTVSPALGNVRLRGVRVTPDGVAGPRRL